MRHHILGNNDTLTKYTFLLLLSSHWIDFLLPFFSSPGHFSAECRLLSELYRPDPRSGFLRFSDVTFSIYSWLSLVFVPLVSSFVEETSGKVFVYFYVCVSDKTPLTALRSHLCSLHFSKLTAPQAKEDVWLLSLFLCFTDFILFYFLNIKKCLLCWPLSAEFDFVRGLFFFFWSLHKWKLGTSKTKKQAFATCFWEQWTQMFSCSAELYIVQRAI